MIGQISSFFSGAPSLSDADADGLRKAERNHKGRGRASDRDLVSCKRSRTQPAHHQGSERKAAHFGEVHAARREADCQQSADLRRKAGFRPPRGKAVLERGIEKHVGNECGGHADARGKRGNARAVEPHGRSAEVSVDEDPVKAHVERYTGNHDPERNPRTRQCLAEVLRSSRKEHRHGGPRAKNEKVLAGGIDLGTLAEPGQEGERRVDRGHHAKAQNTSHHQTGAQRLASHSGPTSAERVRRPDAHRRKHRKSENQRNREQVICKGARGQRDYSHLPNHDRVRPPHEHLSDEARDYGRRQRERTAAFGKGLGKKRHEK